jgi:DNA processing protein
MSSACTDCAARGLLLAELAGHIDRSVSHRAGGRARDLLALSDLELARAVGASDPAGLVREVRSHARHEELGRRLDAVRCWSACVHDGLPEALADLGPAAPRAVFGAGRGDLLPGLGPAGAVTIVGSRRAGPYGREVARRLARLVAASGVAVLSGLALGIDSEAHEGALEAGGLTLAVLASGPDRPYPRSRRGLHGRIRHGGIAISELPPGSPTFRWMFPARNRLMAAMGGITIVVEAAERSGSLITAEMALDCGRAVGAVPGPVTSWRSSGANRLLADGAAVIREAQDVLDLLLGPGAEVAGERGRKLSEDERRILGAVEGGAGTADAVATCGLGLARVLPALGALERAGYLASDATGRLLRTGLAAPPEGAGGSL